MRRPCLRKEIRHRQGNLSVPQHPDVDGVEDKIGSQLGKAFGDDLRIHSLDPPDASCGLNRQGSGAGDAVALVGCNNLDIGRDASPGRWIEAGDREHDRGCGSHKTHCKRKGVPGELPLPLPTTARPDSTSQQ